MRAATASTQRFSAWKARLHWLAAVAAVGIYTLLCVWPQTSAAQIPIGKWRTHISYDATYQLAVGKSRIYATGKMGVMYYDREDLTVRSLDKVNGLSDVGIATIGYDQTTDYLVVIYTNSNIDLIYDDEVYNISDIKRSNITGDKSIYHVRFDKGYAYLACGFGLVKVNILRHEIDNTFYLGTSDNRPSVYDIAILGDSLYAATSHGIMRAKADDPYLNILNHWSIDSTLITRAQPPVALDTFSNKLFVLSNTIQPDTMVLHIYNQAGDYTEFDHGNIRSIHPSQQRLAISKWSVVDLYDLSLRKVLSADGRGSWSGMAANDALLTDPDTMWVAHGWFSLLSFDLRDLRGLCEPDYFTPHGPECNDNVYKLYAHKKKLLVCPGGKQSTYANAYIKANVCTSTGYEWSSIKGAALDTITDILDVAISPTDPDLAMAAAWKYGIIEIKDNTIQNVYNEQNTNNILKPYVSGNYRSLRTGSVAFDDKGDLWVTNSLVNNGLVVRRSNGKWESFNTYAMVGANELDKIIWDSITDYKWFAGRANTIYVHDGVSQMAYVDPNNGSKKNTATVNCLAQDRMGDIWIGTNNGIKVIYDGYKAFNNGGKGEKSPVTCSNIVIGNGEFIEYLMAYENITCIAVDGANRKWVGTANGGLYMLSSSGLEELQHFTTANSPLLSNKIISIAIIPETGEVFVGTDKGIISYRSTATWADTDPLGDIHAFPNPIKPDYDGPIAIKGFTCDAQVHITDASGHVVYTTQALGGQAIWQGRTNSGKRVASGVYFVFAADANGDYKSVTKILVIR